jgi:hypothetical protein
MIGQGEFTEQLRDVDPQGGGVGLLLAHKIVNLPKQDNTQIAVPR